MGAFQIIKNKQDKLSEGPFDDSLIIPTLLLSLRVSPYSLNFLLGKLLQTKRSPSLSTQPTQQRDPVCGPSIGMISMGTMVKVNKEQF